MWTCDVQCFIVFLISLHYFLTHPSSLIILIIYCWSIVSLFFLFFLQKVITSHLQTLCLAENVLTDSSEMTSLVDYFKGDMRLCLLNLQFWINSGGDLTKHNILSSSICHPSDETSVPFRSCDSPNDKLSTKNEISLTHRHCLESSLGLNPNHLQKLFDDSLIRVSYLQIIPSYSGLMAISKEVGIQF